MVLNMVFSVALEVVCPVAVAFNSGGNVRLVLPLGHRQLGFGGEIGGERQRKVCLSKAGYISGVRTRRASLSRCAVMTLTNTK